MRLVNITNSHPQLVNEQLAHTDAQLVEIYSLGQTTVIYTEAKKHNNLVIINKQRKIKESEIDFVLNKLFKTTKDDKRLEVLTCSYFIEISLDKTISAH
ncbi:DUF1827 family protein [Granulicatella sp. zg-ZJ]|uniref:DUF1827 family protein n=1 Tax=unclassified Granulicatella TaxID=2630493 RepID=UPI0013BF9015|nr:MULTISPECIES: DUF1827 family protein [unclassified Granulicatella]MBS4750862.1 DUF1827 family protein [Carnobacteriaceae bacterium zg-ZUI78]NEW62729.1 DUF1827 family protein [Granulicatella sp. zg-ZJ]NEW65571.1 DUF1827 family protein [Granulicatella sp. zg-84]QMI85549.1 DUF1827 family protein [Carnobacteriaceae bacterium zg-84]